MASLKAKNELTEEILKETKLVVSIAVKLTEMVLLMNPDPSEDVFQRTVSMEKEAIKLETLAMTISEKGNMRKLTEEEKSYVERMELYMLSISSASLLGESRAEVIAEECKEGGDDYSPLLRHEGAQTGWATFDTEPRSPRTFPGSATEVRTAHRAHNGQAGEVIDGNWVPED